MLNCLPPLLSQFILPPNILCQVSSCVAGLPGCSLGLDVTQQVVHPVSFLFCVPAVGGQGGGVAKRAEGISGQTNSSGPGS